jgi:excisionase family DNA binding protein
VLVVPDDLLTTAQVARRLGVSSRTLVRYAEKGYVTPAMVLPSGHRRWRLEDVTEQLRALQESRD